jgi:Putative zinc-finger
MNCSDVRAALPEHVYGGLNEDKQAQLEAHLRLCPECQHEAAGLRQVRRLLAATAAPEVKVNTAALYREAAERQSRRVRRWRRFALAACAAGVALVVLTGLARLEIHVGGSELVVRWGPAPAVQPPPSLPDPPAPPVPDHSRDLASIDERLRTLGELTQALAEDGRDRDYQRQQEIARLREQIRDSQGLSAQRLNAMEKDFNALYVAQFSSRKGVSP